MSIDDYKKQAGTTRFRRTKEEIDLGLTPEEALARRTNTKTPTATPKATTKQKTTAGKSGTITITITPAGNVDPDYLTDIGNLTVNLVEDEKFYAWLNTAITTTYGKNKVEELVLDLLDAGINTVIDDLAKPRK